MKPYFNATAAEGDTNQVAENRARFSTSRLQFSFTLKFMPISVDELLDCDIRQAKHSS